MYYFIWYAAQASDISWACPSSKLITLASAPHRRAKANVETLDTVTTRGNSTTNVLSFPEPLQVFSIYPLMRQLTMAIGPCSTARMLA